MIYNSFGGQHGSAHIGIIVVVIAVISLVGFLFWQNILTTDKVTKKPLAVQKDVSNAPKYQLKEWGVQFTIPSSLRSTEIKTDKLTLTNPNKQDVYTFSTKRIEALGGYCVKQGNNPRVAPDVLYRLSSIPTMKASSILLNKNPINGYYYVLASGGQNCSSYSPDGKQQPAAQIELQDRVALKILVRSIQSSN